MEVEDEEADPISVIVQQQVEASLMKLNFYRSYQELENVLTGVLMSSHKVIFLIDAPSSKARVMTNLIDWAARLMNKIPCAQNCRFLVPVSSRLDMLSAVEVRMLTSLPDMHHFSIQLNSGDEQKLRKKAAYMHYACSTKILADGKVPCSIPAQAARAQRGECTRLRCLDSQCPLRSQAEKLALQGLGDPTKIPNDAEIDADDRETENVDELMQEETEADPNADALAQLVNPSFHRRDCIVDLWPFAFGKEFYKALFNGLAPNESVDHLVVLTTSAHPSSALAGHERHMSVHVLLDQIKDHSVKHGDSILRSWLTRTHDAIERKKVDPADKRFRSEDLFFVKIQAPETQAVHFVDVPADQAKSVWRAGMDCMPDSAVLEKGILDLVAKELTDHHLSVALRRGRHVLTTTRALKEGATICPVSALLFSKPELVRDFLNVGSHGALSDSPLLNVEGLDTIAGKRAMSVHAVLVGVARLVTDYRGFRKNSNCSFRISPEAGANDDFISLVVQTHNGCGVAAGSEIMADLGEGFVPGVVAEKPPSKKFKGALDALFEKQLLEAGEDASNGLDAAKSAGVAEAQAGAAAASAGTATDSTASAAGTATAAGAGAAGAATASATGAAAAAGAAAAGAAAAGAATDSAAGAATGAASGSGAQSAAGTATCLGSHNGLNVMFKANKVTVCNTTKTNTKVPPNSVLVTLDQGRLTEANPAREHLDIPFNPTPKMTVFLKTPAATTLMTLADVIKKHGATQLYQHHGFPKSSPPAAFQAKKKSVLAPT